MKKYLPYLAAAVLSFSAVSAQAGIINVPADQPTIQQAINTAVDGDTVQIAAGTYLEHDIYVTKSLTIQGAGASTIIDAEDKGRGFAIFRESKDSLTVTVKNLRVTRGSVTQGSYELFDDSCGGGIVAYDLQGLTLDGVIIDHSKALYNDSDLLGFRGAGLCLNRVVKTDILNSEIKENQAQLFGGGIYSRESFFNLKNSTVSGNSVLGGDFDGIAEGGGIYVDGRNFDKAFSKLFVANQLSDYAGVVENSTFSGNTSTGNGGGISRDAAMLFLNSTISGNTAAFNGGGIYSNDDSSSCVIPGIIIDADIDSNFQFPGTFIHVTVANNHANRSGGGIHSTGDCYPTELKNTLLVKNTSAPNNTDLPDNCFGDSYYSYNYNSSDDTTCDDEFTQANDQKNDPNSNVGPLANNGGSTMTHALLTGSSAIDKIPADACTKLADGGVAAPVLTEIPLTNDQRNFPRPVDVLGTGLKCDIGAYEAQKCAISVIPTSLAFTTDSDKASDTQKVTITNNGVEAIDLTSETITGSNAGLFTISANTCGASLAAGASCEVTITYASSNIGTFSDAQLEIKDACTPLTVKLVGTTTGLLVEGSGCGSNLGATNSVSGLGFALMTMLPLLVTSMVRRRQ